VSRPLDVTFDNGCIMTSLFADFSTSTFIASLLGSGTTAWLAVRSLGGHLADRWIARYKSELDREFESYRDTLEQKRKRLEAELSHAVYTTQSRFDTEFNAIKDIFAALGRLRLAFNGMRPFLDRAPVNNEEKTQEVRRRLDLFSERYNALVDTANSLYPFVPEDIYAELETCMNAAIIEIKDVQQAGGDALSPQGYAEGATQNARFSTAYYKAAKLARERFDRLSVISR
jgi:hypothetical protein